MQPRRRGGRGRGRPRGGPASRRTAPSRAGASSAPALEPTPCDTTPVPFASLGLDPRLLEGIRDLGFNETRPIQSAVIPLALAGHDLIACAETGTGKTAAFVVPTLQRLLRDHGKNVAAEADSGAAAQEPRPGARADARARGADRRRDPRPRVPHHRHQRRGLRRRRDGHAGARAQGRRRHHRRHAGPADGSHAAAERRPQRHRAAGARRSRPHDGHGLLARRPPHHHRDAGRSRQTLLFSATMPDEVVRRALEIVRDAEVRAGRPAQRAGRERSRTASKRSRRRDEARTG